MKPSTLRKQIREPVVHDLIGLLRYRAVHQPRQVAFRFLQDGETESYRLTYEALDRRARAIAARLQAQFVAGERALLLYSSSMEFIAAFFGCLYAGLLAVPAYPPRRNRADERLLAIAADAQPKVLLATTDIIARMQQRTAHAPGLKALPWLATDAVDGALAETWQEPAVQSDTLAFLQYTSGSTGSPKGVMVSHANLLHNLAVIADKFGHTPESRGVIWLPLYHDMGLIGGVLQPLFAGFPVVLMSPHVFLQKPVRWLQAITRYRATTSGGPNFGYELCVGKIPLEQRESLDLSRWELAFSGAEPVRSETLERFCAAFAPYGFQKRAFYPCYGLAEGTLLVSGGRKTALPRVENVYEEPLEHDHEVETPGQASQIRSVVGCGQSSPDQEVLIVHPHTLEACSPGQVGEVWVCGPSVTQGYWNRPEETQRIFQAVAAKTGKGPYLRTGDLGFVKAGELFISGRLKDLIIINGRNYYPEDIEWHIEHASPLIRPSSCAAFSVDVDNETRLIVAAEIHSRLKSRPTLTAARSDSGPERRHAGCRPLNS